MQNSFPVNLKSVFFCEFMFRKEMFYIIQITLKSAIYLMKMWWDIVIFATMFYITWKGNLYFSGFHFLDSNWNILTFVYWEFKKHMTSLNNQHFHCIRENVFFYYNYSNLWIVLNKNKYKIILHDMQEL